jgi:hypothetical protein
MSDTYQKIVFYLILFLTIISVMIFNRNKTLSKVLEQIFSAHSYQDSGQFKSKFIFVFLRYSNIFFKNIYLALSVFVIMYSIFMLQVKMFALGILIIIVVPVITRIMFLPYLILFKSKKWFDIKKWTNKQLIHINHDNYTFNLYRKKQVLKYHVSCETEIPVF